MGNSAVEATLARPWPLLLARPLRVGLALLLLVGVESAPTRAAEDTLPQSRKELDHFPFRPNCGGNTREMVACLWQRRNASDSVLTGLLGSPELLEQWRASRRRVCGRAALKVEGGSIQPLVWLRCENALNQELLRQIQRPLFQSVDL
jgi:hypothetical protein